MKEFYTKPEMEVIQFEAEDIIAVSGTGTDDFDQGGDGDWEVGGGWD